MNHLRIPPIHIHPILFFFIILTVLTGMFVEFTIIFLIVLFHELGHYFCARMFNWRIQRIFLWIFGGVMETDEYGTRPMKEEWFVTLAGPFQHVIIFLFLFLMEKFAVLPSSVLFLAYQYNLFILFGNLLPIWPLDGGKLVQLALESTFSYRRAHQYMLVISLLAISSAIIYLYTEGLLTLSVVLLISFLIWENRLEWKRRYFKWWRFLWHRYSTKKDYSRVYELKVQPSERILDVFKQLHRETQHHITVANPPGDDVYVAEKECLHLIFTESNPDTRMEHFLSRADYS